jgi:hypothetical protein
MIHLRADNGDYIDVGFSNFEWFDYGFHDTGLGVETRNWGWETFLANYYDGSATIANGEVQNCGDFTTDVGGKLNLVYQEIYDLESGFSRANFR